MWSFVQTKVNPRWLWHAIDHHTGKVLAYVFGRRKDAVFLKLQQLLEPLGITKFYTDGWGACERHIDTKKHHVGKENTQKIESKHINLQTRIKRLVRRTLCLSKTERMHDTAALTRSARNRDPGEKFLRHTLLRTGLRFAVTVAVAARSDIEIAYWMKDGSIRIPITYQAEDGTLVEDTVIPDDVLGIRWHATGRVETLLLESDKRKDYPRVRKKMLAYVQLARQIKHGTARLPIAAPPVVRDLRRSRQVRPHQRVYALAGQPIVHFRVLWVAKGAERKDGLRQLARDLEGPHSAAAGLLWFTHEAQYLEEPARVLGPVWQKARNETWRQVLGG
jgi:insertion element IS1 protein InsB